MNHNQRSKMATIPKQLKHGSEMQRWYALSVLLVVFVLIYFMFFQGFFTEHGLLNEELTDLEQNRKDFTELQVLIPELQKRINTVKETVGDSTNFLVADSYNLGTAELTRILKGIVAENTANRSECDIISNSPSKDRDPDQFERIILKVRMRCQFEKIVNVFERIENNVPHLFVDNLHLDQRVVRRSRRNTKPVHPMIDVRYDLYAYMNNPIRARIDDKK